MGWGHKVYVGDCNQDGEINVADYEALKSYLALICSDNDGSIT